MLSKHNWRSPSNEFTIFKRIRQVGNYVTNYFRPELDPEQGFGHFRRRQQVGQLGHGDGQNVAHLRQVYL